MQLIELTDVTVLINIGDLSELTEVNNVRGLIRLKPYCSFEHVVPSHGIAAHQPFVYWWICSLFTPPSLWASSICRASSRPSKSLKNATALILPTQMSTAQSVEGWLHTVASFDSSVLIKSSPPSPLLDKRTATKCRRPSSVQTSPSRARITATLRSGLKRSRSDSGDHLVEVEAIDRMAPKQKDVS